MEIIINYQKGACYGKKIDYLLQDAKVLITAVDNNRVEMEKTGFTEERYSGLTKAESELRKNETEQQNVVKFLNSKTGEQNAAINKVSAAISQTQKAAKSAFGRDTILLKKFRIGETIPVTVKKLSTWASYFAALSAENKEILLKNGMTENDITNLNAGPNLLIAADAAQESAKSQQKAATLVRDKAAEVLRDQIYRTRNFAATCFSKQPEILLQFKAIPKSRGKSGGQAGENPPAEPQN